MTAAAAAQSTLYLSVFVVFSPFNLQTNRTAHSRQKKFYVHKHWSRVASTFGQQRWPNDKVRRRQFSWECSFRARCTYALVQSFKEIFFETVCLNTLADDTHAHTGSSFHSIFRENTNRVASTRAPPRERAARAAQRKFNCLKHQINWTEFNWNK